MGEFLTVSHNLLSLLLYWFVQ